MASSSDSSPSPMAELIGFLSPTTRLDIRRAALEYVVGVSGALDGSAGKLFMEDQFAMGKALCQLCEATVSDRSPTLAALTNFASGSAEAADFILQRSKVALIAFDACKLHAPFATYAARLLANLSRHFPDRVQTILKGHDDTFLSTIIDLVSSSPDDDSLVLLGYVLINLTTLSRARHELVDSRLLSRVYPLLSLSTRHREIGADVLRNLAFEDGLHSQLLGETDEFLVGVLSPLADSLDELDDEETQKLPVRLQYFDGSREQSHEVRQKLIEALYQLCATRCGREKLREKGVYALMRELDRATMEMADPTAPPPKMRPPVLLAQEEHTLHALIGVLIRYEEEMGVEVESLKQLE